MKQDEYQYLADTLAGRRARDPEFESKMNVVVDLRVEERQHLIDSKTPEQRELDQRRYSLNVYGREHMKRYATPIISDRPLGELGIEGDQIKGASPQARGHNGEEKGRKKDSPQQLKGHSGVEEPEPWCDANGRLLLQTHGGIKQVLQLM
jgi:hypothetical protein